MIKYLASGDGEIRTLDPLLARQVLSQLSYTPASPVTFAYFYMTAAMFASFTDLSKTSLFFKWA